MPLVTKEIRQQLPALYSQEGNPDPLAVVRFYDQLGDWNWYATEFDGSHLFFGVVLGFERELGYFSLLELERANREAGFDRIIRDLYFAPTRVSQIHR